MRMLKRWNPQTGGVKRAGLPSVQLRQKQLRVRYTARPTPIRWWPESCRVKRVDTGSILARQLFGRLRGKRLGVDDRLVPATKLREASPEFGVCPVAGVSVARARVLRRQERVAPLAWVGLGHIVVAQSRSLNKVGRDKSVRAAARLMLGRDFPTPALAVSAPSWRAWRSKSPRVKSTAFRHISTSASSDPIEATRASSASSTSHARSSASSTSRRRVIVVCRLWSRIFVLCARRARVASGGRAAMEGLSSRSRDRCQGPSRTSPPVVNQVDGSHLDLSMQLTVISRL